MPAEPEEATNATQRVNLLPLLHHFLRRRAGGSSIIRPLYSGRKRGVTPLVASRVNFCVIHGACRGPRGRR